MVYQYQVVFCTNVERLQYNFTLSISCTLLLSTTSVGTKLTHRWVKSNTTIQARFFVLLLFLLNIHFPPKVWKHPWQSVVLDDITLPSLTPNTLPSCANPIWRGNSQLASCLSWNVLPNHPTSTQLSYEELDRDVRKKCPTSVNHLWAILQEAWSNISSQCLDKLTARMPRLCRAVIAANGGYFDESKI